MDIKTVQDALKLEQEFNSKLTQQFEALHKDRKLTAPALIEEKEKALERIEKDIEMAAKERDLILSRWDQRIEQRKALLAKLRLEIDELKKQIGR